jgi:imidazole glycerol-phosphate synthase subunit HisH
MCSFSEENNTTCLGIFNAAVKLFPPTELVPHMGWNNVEASNSKFFEGITINDNFYFVHSYYAAICENTIATCNYILPFSAAMQKDNFYATQFHPEKSADVGERVLKNFLRIESQRR